MKPTYDSASPEMNLYYDPASPVAVTRPEGPSNAEFSPCRRWRYTLWRSWEPYWHSWLHDDPIVTPGYLMVIGLNPSTADEQKNDPTVTRCINYAKRWGFEALCMTNIFAWRDTDPQMMFRADDPIGPENNRWLRDISKGAGMILAAWGAHGYYRMRQGEVSDIIRRPVHCLAVNKNGSPKHPLYAKGDITPFEYWSL